MKPDMELLADRPRPMPEIKRPRAEPRLDLVAAQRGSAEKCQPLRRDFSRPTAHRDGDGASRSAPVAACVHTYIHNLQTRGFPAEQMMLCSSGCFVAQQRASFMWPSP